MTEVPARLSIVTLGVRNMGVLRSFYRELGWPELPIGDASWTGFLLGGVLLALFPLPDLTAEAVRPAVKDRLDGRASRWPARSVLERRLTPPLRPPWRQAGLQWPTPLTGRGAGARRSWLIPRAIAGRSPGRHGLPSTRAARCCLGAEPGLSQAFHTGARLASPHVETESFVAVGEVLVASGAKPSWGHLRRRSAWPACRHWPSTADLRDTPVYRSSRLCRCWLEVVCGAHSAGPSRPPASLTRNHTRPRSTTGS